MEHINTRVWKETQGTNYYWTIANWLQRDRKHASRLLQLAIDCWQSSKDFYNWNEFACRRRTY